MKLNFGSEGDVRVGDLACREMMKWLKVCCFACMLKVIKNWTMSRPRLDYVDYNTCMGNKSLRMLLIMHPRTTINPVCFVETTELS